MQSAALKPIVDQLFAILPETAWKGKSLDEIEAEAQQLLQQMGTLLLQEHLLPARVQEIEDRVHTGELRCESCQQPYQLHQQHQAIHPKAIFGGKNHVEP
jgi:hypothetical protein